MASTTTPSSCKLSKLQQSPVSPAESSPEAPQEPSTKRRRVAPATDTLSAKNSSPSSGDPQSATSPIENREVPALDDPRVIVLPDGTVKKRRGRLPGMKMQPHWKKPGRKPRSVAKANYVGKLSFLQTLLLTQLSDTIAKRREDQLKRHREVAAALLSTISAKMEARAEAHNNLAEDEKPVAYTIQVTRKEAFHPASSLHRRKQLERAGGVELERDG